MRVEVSTGLGQLTFMEFIVSGVASINGCMSEWADVGEVSGMNMKN